MKKKLFNLLTISLIAFSLSFCNQNKDKPQGKQETEKETPAETAKVTTTEAVTIAEQPDADTLKGSLKAITTGKIGSVNLIINYHSPAVRKRVVWGGLVPYDQVWVTGAHSATTIQTDGIIKVGGQEIPAGKFAFFTVPGKQDWTIILNKNWEQHLADEYSAKDDIIRISVKAQKTAKPQERLRYVVTSAGADKGTIEMHWEHSKISVPVEL